MCFCDTQKNFTVTLWYNVLTNHAGATFSSHPIHTNFTLQQCDNDKKRNCVVSRQRTLTVGKKLNNAAVEEEERKRYIVF